MTLRWKALLVFLSASIALAAILLTVQRTILLPAFVRLERESADADVMRGRHALRSDGEFLAAMATDYGAWDDTYDFVQDGNERYILANLVPETFHNLRVDAVLILNQDGRTVWGGSLVGNDSIAAVPPGIVAAIRATPALARHRIADSRASGIVTTDHGIALAGSAAITSSKRTAEPRGAVVMLRFIDVETSRELAERTCVDLHLLPIDAAMGLDPAVRTAAGTPAGTWLAAEEPDTLRVCALVRGVDAKPALVLRADVPRLIVGRARDAAKLSVWTTLCAGSLLLGVLWIAVTRMIVNPLGRVTRHAVRVGSEGDLDVRLNLTSNDEIGRLARAFDHMVDQVADSRRHLLDTAHDAGRSEIATSVLHNVGNALNSVNVSASLIRDQIERSEAKAVDQLAALLKRHEGDLAQFLTHDPHGKAVPHFVDELAMRLTHERQMLEGEVQTLSDAISHIRFIIEAQQEHVGPAVVLEYTGASALVNESLALAASPAEWSGIHVVHPHADDVKIHIDRRRVLQILSNVLSNARQAVFASRTPPEITVEVDRTVVEGQEYLQFRVRDNGIGIPPENLARIFRFGFTTRQDGHGIGLHTAANLAREIGGSLQAESAGAGRGAMFTLLVPMAMEEVPV